MNKHKRVKHSAFNLCMKVANFTRALNLKNGKGAVTLKWNVPPNRLNLTSASKRGNENR